MSRGCKSKSIRNYQKETIAQTENRETQRANQELILQISCDTSITFTKKNETEAQTGEQLAYMEALEKS